MVRPADALWVIGVIGADQISPAIALIGSYSIFEVPALVECSSGRKRSRPRRRRQCQGNGRLADAAAGNTGIA